MRAIALAMLVACSNKTTAPPAIVAIDVRVDRRFELVAIVQRLAQMPSYTKSPSMPYVDDVDRAFAPFARHPVIAATQALRAEHSISWDGPMGIAAHLDDKLYPRNAEELAAEDPTRFGGVDLAAYATLLRDFADASHANAFFDAHAAHYAKVETILRDLAVRENPIPWFDGIFGRRDHAVFTIVPGMLTNRMNYGVHATVAGTTEVFAVIGLHETDGMPTTDELTVSLLVHELGHSYVNPMMAQHATELASIGPKLYLAVEPIMQKQHYGMWQVVLDESVVRAVTTLYMAETKGVVSGMRAAKTELDLGFRWTNDLVEALRTHPKDLFPAIRAAFEAAANL